VRHRIKARAPGDAALPPIEHDAAILASFLSDAAHVPGGFSTGVAFPRTEADVSALLRHATRVLPVGAQSSLTGGATPRGDLVLSTRALTAIGTPASGSVRAGAGVPLLELQRRVGDHGLYYPPVPTFDGAFVGGSIATNAAGAATFKYGSVRRWVNALTVVLASGEVLDLARGEVTASDTFEIESAAGDVTVVPVPTYSMPAVPKLSAGYYAAAGMDLVDLFIGSEGTLGVIVDAMLKVIPRPRRGVALVPCAGDRQAITVTSALRAAARDAWQGRGALDVSAIEYMDERALRAAATEAFTRAGLETRRDDSVLLLVQLEMTGEDAAMEAFLAVLHACGVEADPIFAAPGDDRGAQRLFDLREAVPAGVNAIVAAAKKTAHPDIEKTAGDMIVPFEHLAESLALYRRAFERRGLDYAIWGHVSDGNLHPNVIPRSLEDVRHGREAILEMAHGVMALGGAPLAEHGVGRSALKQRLLRELYGEEGIAQMRAVKRALDPAWKLAPGVLFAGS
jgi:D-lactate dehydrogenase (cytochrome)